MSENNNNKGKKKGNDIVIDQNQINIGNVNNNGVTDQN